MPLSEKARNRLVELAQNDGVHENMNPVFLSTQTGGLTRVESWDGRSWFVAETVAVISQVLNGELLPPEEIVLFAESWNGRPVPVRHPQREGVFVSANSPDVLTEYNVGYFFNARADTRDGKVRLKGEMWIDEDRVQSMGGPALDALTALRGGGVVEVSTAYFCLVNEEAGELDGVPYSGVQYNIKPDHVALLPDQIGACSIADGCGVGRANACDCGTPQDTQDAQDAPEQAERVNVLGGDESAWIAVLLSPRASEALRIEGGEEDLHVTLAYLGTGAQVEIDRQELLQLCREIAAHYFAHTATIEGVFRFYESGATGYLVESDTLRRMREVLVAELSLVGQFVSRPNDYIPHVTLSYEDGTEVPPPGIDRFAVTGLTVWYGEDQVTFPLIGDLGAVNEPQEDTITMEIVNMTEEQKEALAVQGDVQDIPSPEEVQDAQEAGGPDLEALAGFMADVEAFGGFDALRDALATIAANNEAERQAAEVKVLGLTDAFTRDDLGTMDLAQLIKLGEALVKNAQGTPAPKTPALANYGVNGSGVAVEPKETVTVNGIGELRPFDMG